MLCIDSLSTTAPIGSYAVYSAVRIAKMVIMKYKLICRIMSLLVVCSYAGVILSTALIHILPGASSDLSNPCLGLSTGVLPRSDHLFMESCDVGFYIIFLNFRYLA